jgi:hypothetical protein
MASFCDFLYTPFTHMAKIQGYCWNEVQPERLLDFPEGIGCGYPAVDLISNSVYIWNGMQSPLLTRISFATASSMSILSMLPGTPNSTYVMNFNGPSLKCEEPNYHTDIIYESQVSIHTYNARNL